MILDEYNSLPADLKLDARLAITLGMVSIIYIPKYDPCPSIWVRGEYLGFDKNWQPRQDHAILWSLINAECILGFHEYKDKWCVTALSKHGDMHYAESKSMALIRAYCEADPHGHWAKWCKENEVAV